MSNKSACAFKVALDPTPAQHEQLTRHADVATDAYNILLAKYKENISIRKQEAKLYGEPQTEPMSTTEFDLIHLRNANKDTWYPWWHEVSKEAPRHGIRGFLRCCEELPRQ